MYFIALQRWDGADWLTVEVIEQTRSLIQARRIAVRERRVTTNDPHLWTDRRIAILSQDYHFIEGD